MERCRKGEQRAKKTHKLLEECLYDYVMIAVMPENRKMNVISFFYSTVWKRHSPMQ